MEEFSGRSAVFSWRSCVYGYFVVWRRLQQSGVCDSTMCKAIRNLFYYTRLQIIKLTYTYLDSLKLID